MNGAKAKILVFCLSLLFGGLCLGLCFLDGVPFYPAKIAGTVIFTVWGFSAIPAYVAAVAWMRARAEGLYSRFGFLRILCGYSLQYCRFCLRRFLWCITTYQKICDGKI